MSVEYAMKHFTHLSKHPAYAVNAEDHGMLQNSVFLRNIKFIGEAHNVMVPMN